MRNKRKIYSIITVNHGKRKKTICSEETEAKIYKRFNALLKENQNVIFPMRYNNEKHVMVESEHELVIIKCKELGDSSVNKIRDDSGKFVNYVSTDDDWIIIDRAKYEVEETFWVYGYHPKLQRKTFEWIFNEFVSKDAKNKYMFKAIHLYHNKIIIECNGELNMVLCKNKNDSMRFYNLLEEWCNKRKMKYVMFMGDISKSKHRGYWIKRLMDLCGWSSKKVERISTRE